MRRKRTAKVQLPMVRLTQLLKVMRQLKMVKERKKAEKDLPRRRKRETVSLNICDIYFNYREEEATAWSM